MLAQIEVAFSNSLIGAWWRSLRNKWLHLSTLDTAAGVRRLTSCYVAEHSTKGAHAALHGQTPDEVYFGRGDHVPEELAEAARLARYARPEANRRLGCDARHLPVAETGASEHLPAGQREAK